GPLHVEAARDLVIHREDHVDDRPHRYAGQLARLAVDPDVRVRRHGEGLAGQVARRLVLEGDGVLLTIDRLHGELVKRRPFHVDIEGGLLIHAQVQGVEARPRGYARQRARFAVDPDGGVLRYAEGPAVRVAPGNGDGVVPGVHRLHRTEDGRPLRADAADRIRVLKMAQEHVGPDRQPGQLAPLAVDADVGVPGHVKRGLAVPVSDRQGALVGVHRLYDTAHKCWRF